MRLALTAMNRVVRILKKRIFFIGSKINIAVVWLKTNYFLK